MCSICPKCHPPQEYIDLPEGASFGPFSPILPVPVVEPDDREWSNPRLFDFPVGGLICSCPPGEDRLVLPAPSEAAPFVPVCPVLPLPVYIDEASDE